MSVRDARGREFNSLAVHRLRDNCIIFWRIPAFEFECLRFVFIEQSLVWKDFVGQFEKLVFYHNGYFYFYEYSYWKSNYNTFNLELYYYYFSMRKLISENETSIKFVATKTNPYICLEYMICRKCLLTLVLL